MARFCGTVQGNRGETSRLGGKDSGITTYAASWRGAVRVHAYCNDEGVDCAIVSLQPWQGRGISKELWRGSIDGSEEELESNEGHGIPPDATVIVR